MGKPMILVPDVVRHNFLFAFDLTESAIDNRKVFRCKYCNRWTDNEQSQIAIMGICPQRERRREQRRNSSIGGRRDKERNAIIQALALRDIENAFRN
jgi:hypothetical protein